MSKSIALGLVGAGAILLAILLTGCTDAPSPTPSAEGRSHSPESPGADAWLRHTAPTQPHLHLRPPRRLNHGRPTTHAHCRNRRLHRHINAGADCYAR